MLPRRGGGQSSRVRSGHTHDSTGKAGDAGGSTDGIGPEENLVEARRLAFGRRVQNPSPIDGHRYFPAELRQGGIPPIERSRGWRKEGP